MEFIQKHIEHIANIKQVNFSLIYQLKTAGKFEYESENGFILRLQTKLLDLQIDETNRTDIIEWVNTKRFSAKELCLIIFCWGVYFTIMRARNQSNCRALIKFFNDTPDNFFENIRDNIYASTWKNNNELGELFKKHTAGEFQIPGIKYAFFTKLFFFFSKDNTLPILDKWLLTAYVFLLKNEGNTTLEEINYNMNFLLTKKKENAYCLYVRYMNEIANSFHIPLNNLETFLFGWPYNKKNTLAPYLNPRITYKNYFKENS